MKRNKSLSSAQIGTFRRKIYAYYNARGRRDLAWRKTKDAYRILVSEFMLQQTQVIRVAEKYGPFIERFPDFESLARSGLRDVLREWSGLGYNRRALHLRETARIIVNCFDGKAPAEFDRLLALPGIGRATASGICAFAFGEARPFLETNIRAVYIHFFFPRRERVADSRLLPLVQQTLDRKNPRKWFYALMDYGAALKREHANPSRRSAHYAKQGGFEGSNRQSRGRIVKALAGRSMDEDELAGATGLSRARIRSVIPGLARDGLVVKRGDTFSIA